MVDITPKPEGETRILFVPDPRRRYEGLAIDNVRMPLRDDLLIKHFIQMSSDRPGDEPRRASIPVWGGERSRQ